MVCRSLLVYSPFKRVPEERWGYCFSKKGTLINVSTRKRYHTREKGRDTAIADCSFLSVKEWEQLRCLQSRDICAS